jgi:hypothetical protein
MHRLIAEPDSLNLPYNSAPENRFLERISSPVQSISAWGSTVRLGLLIRTRCASQHVEHMLQTTCCRAQIQASLFGKLLGHARRAQVFSIYRLPTLEALGNIFHLQTPGAFDRTLRAGSG